MNRIKKQKLIGAAKTLKEYCENNWTHCKDCIFYEHGGIHKTFCGLTDWPNYWLDDTKIESDLSWPMPVKSIVRNLQSSIVYDWRTGRKIAYYIRDALYYCQNCNELLGDDLDGKPPNMNYCPHCGQKLWWKK